LKAVLTTEHGDLSVLRFVRDYPRPEPGEHTVVLDVAATAVNFHDLFTRRGMPGVRLRLPVITGSDIAGTVVQVGPSVAGEWIGKRVLVDPVYRDGKNAGMVGETVDGGRAEQVAVLESQLIEIPEGVKFEAAAALPLAYGTAWRMMITKARICAGESVLILGASGGVGVACVQIAKLAGATVVACAGSPDKIARLREIGADHVVNYQDTPFREAVHQIMGKPRVAGTGGVDIAVNFTGGDTMVDTQKCVKLGGRIVSCGATAGYELSLDARYWWTFEHSMIGSDGWSVADLHELLNRVASGQLDPVIDKILPLEEAVEAERMLEDRKVIGKVLLKP
jgi:alcohol dehydrogenase